MVLNLVSSLAYGGYEIPVLSSHRGGLTHYKLVESVQSCAFLLSTVKTYLQGSQIWCSKTRCYPERPRSGWECGRLGRFPTITAGRLRVRHGHPLPPARRTRNRAAERGTGGHSQSVGDAEFARRQPMIHPQFNDPSTVPCGYGSHAVPAGHGSSACPIII